METKYVQIPTKSCLPLPQCVRSQNCYFSTLHVEQTNTTGLLSLKMQGKIEVRIFSAKSVKDMKLAVKGGDVGGDHDPVGRSLCCSGIYCPPFSSAPIHPPLPTLLFTPLLNRPPPLLLTPRRNDRRRNWRRIRWRKRQNSTAADLEPTLLHMARPTTTYSSSF